MGDCWKTLQRAGLPLGAARPQGALPSARELLEALEGALADAHSDQELLAAWLCGFQHHFPALFGRLLGRRGAEAIERLTPGVRDVNRYLKLRRIAAENLSRATG